MKNDSAGKSIDGIRRTRRVRPVSAGRQPMASYRHYSHNTDEDIEASLDAIDVADTTDGDIVATIDDTNTHEPEIVSDEDIEASLDAIGDIDDDMPKSTNTPPPQLGVIINPTP